MEPGQLFWGGFLRWIYRESGTQVPSKHTEFCLPNTREPNTRFLGTWLDDEPAQDAIGLPSSPHRTNFLVVQSIFLRKEVVDVTHRMKVKHFQSCRLFHLMNNSDSLALSEHYRKWSILQWQAQVYSHRIWLAFANLPLNRISDSVTGKAFCFQVSKLPAQLRKVKTYHPACLCRRNREMTLRGTQNQYDKYPHSSKFASQSKLSARREKFTHRLFFEDPQLACWWKANGL